MKDFFELQRCLALLAGKEIKIVVERGPDGAKRDSRSLGSTCLGIARWTCA